MTITTTERNGKEYFTIKSGSATYGFHEKAKAEAMLTRLQQSKPSSTNNTVLVKPKSQSYQRDGWDL